MGVQPARTYNVNVVGTRGSFAPAEGLINRLAEQIAKAKAKAKKTSGLEVFSIGLEVSGHENKCGMPPSFLTLLKKHAEYKGVPVVLLDSKASSIKYNALVMARDFEPYLINEIYNKAYNELLECQTQSAQKETPELKEKLEEAKRKHKFFKLVKKFVENPEKIDKALDKINERRNETLVARILEHRPAVVIVDDRRVGNIVEALNKVGCKANVSYLESMDVPRTPYHASYLEELRSRYPPKSQRAW